MFNPTQVVIQAFVEELKEIMGRYAEYWSPRIPASSASLAGWHWKTLPTAMLRTTT